ncbi:hypothetical protein Prudu_42S000300 [Prunus dulcis]|uniref:Uncharacterized protein n=1 Tax=Prunus dulcis TaxID=3755 RepID=A0A5H2XFQ0_PRUDU|nr:hypothetical protein Prudu_42S000300 [Prunus dulcis]
MKLYSDHSYAAGGTLSGSGSVGLLNVSLECYKHYPMYLSDLELGYGDLRYLECRNPGHP